MSSPVVAPLIPPRTRSRGGTRPSNAVTSPGRRQVPLARVTTEPQRTTVYGFAVVNDRGRIAAQPIVQALGWQPGTPLSIRVRAGLVLIAADADGASRLTGEGHVRLPAAVRLSCRIESGGRVLLVADPDVGRLVVHPAASLDAMVDRQHADVLGGA